jgi:hypothetical protein
MGLASIKLECWSLSVTSASVYNLQVRLELTSAEPLRGYTLRVSS